MSRRRGQVAQQTFDFSSAPPTTGSELKAHGQRKALATADRFSPGWSEQAYEQFKSFVAEHPGREFLGEVVREWAYGRGLDKPLSERAWGAIISRAARDGLIVRIGTASVTNAKAHRANAALWKAL